MGKLHIYVDGSCLENRNVDSSTRAGWGFCVIEGDSGVGNGKGSLIYEKCGLVETQRDSESFIGAEVGSNNTAELSAIGHALRWMLVHAPSESVVIFGDSKYALNVASGIWNPKANRELAEMVRGLWNEAESLVSLGAAHVSAHKGHRWNERADHLAFRAMKGEVPLPLQFWKPGLR